MIDQGQPNRTFISTNIPKLACLALVVLLVASMSWAVVAQLMLHNANGDIAELEREISSIRERSNATVYELTPSSEAPVNASGQAFFALDGSGIVSVANLEPPPGGRAYQIWYYPRPDAEPIPGATIAIDDEGSGSTLIPADAGLFTDISITLEPESGTTVPSGSVFLHGSTGGARG